ncbi:hypothetical protein PRIPAC_88859, partial [Pristionchus pacificus]
SVEMIRRSMESIELMSNGHNGRSPSGETQETVVETSVALTTPSKERKEKTHEQIKEDMADAAFRADPFNKEELIHTLKGRELYFFVIFYIIGVAFIVLIFEFFKPVLFNPNYPNDPS